MRKVLSGQDLIDAGAQQDRWFAEALVAANRILETGGTEADALAAALAISTASRVHRNVRRVISEAEFAGVMRLRLRGVKARAVVGPGRSGAVASTYASYLLGIPFLPYAVPCPAHLRPLLIVDTARKSGATLRKAERLYGGGECVTVWAFDEPPRVRFWYEQDAQSPVRTAA
jgi:hypothetical protein